ncbi:MAG: ABC transporter permease [Anaerolineales bacterium]|nr:ABC transporter permease [Anaerolineales bacterium]
MKTFNERLRVIWAIASKDFLDAFKNRTILSQFLTVLFLVVVYRFLPEFESKDVLPRLAVYDQGRSQWVVRWEGNQDFDLIRAETQESMERYIADKDFAILGLVLPADFDQMVERGGIMLDGYVVHWAFKRDVDQVVAFFERELSNSVGQTLSISLEGHTVHTQMDSRGYAFLGGVSVVFAAAIGSMLIVPHMMIDEKQTRTIDALMVSPATFTEMMIAKAIAGSIFALLGGAIALVVHAVLVNHWWLAILALVSGSFFFVAVGLLLGSVLDQKQQMTLWGFVLTIFVLLPAFLSLMEGLLIDEVMVILQWAPSVAILNLSRLSFTDQVALPTLGLELVKVLGWALVCHAVIQVVLRKREDHHA